MSVSVEERKGAATLRGNEFTVLGRELKVATLPPTSSWSAPAGRR